jgi:outer membrane protein OmpA-like peptidoglycan-associated protein
MARLIAVATLGALCATGVQAQQLSGQLLDLVFKVEDLALRIENLTLKVEDLEGRSQSLQVRQTAIETRIELPADILFDFDRANIRSAAEPTLRETANLIRKGARGIVTIEGHTDTKGSDTYNRKLSEQRSESVRRWLIEREGLRDMHFQIKGFGETRPVAPNTKPDGSDDPEGRQKNRRVEIVFGRR